MPRIARVVVPGLPHHVTQRGNRRQQTFFSDADYEHYLDLLREWSARTGVRIWCYCLMPNHVHLIAVPAEEQALARCMSEVHRRYTRSVNFRHDWRGHLWQGRFASFVMEESHLVAAARYVLLNPVRAGLVDSPEAWRYSSIAAHLSGRGDGIVEIEPLDQLVTDWRRLLCDEPSINLIKQFQLHEGTGRPLGGDPFVCAVELLAGRSLRPQRRGPKPADPLAP